MVPLTGRSEPTDERERPGTAIAVPGRLVGTGGLPVARYWAGWVLASSCAAFILAWKSACFFCNSAARAC